MERLDYQEVSGNKLYILRSDLGQIYTNLWSQKRFAQEAKLLKELHSRYGNGEFIYLQDYEDLNKDVNVLGYELSQTRKMADKLFSAAAHANVSSDIMSEVTSLQESLNALDTELNGNPAKNQRGERNRPTRGDRVFALWRGISTSTYGPTETHQETMRIIKEQWEDLKTRLEAQQIKARSIADKVEAAGGSWVEGR